MARAKRTNRAEARRRYRAQVAAQSDAAELDTPDTPMRPVEPAPRAGRTPSEPPRSGMRYAFRAAIHPPNLREDLAHLPEILGSRALWGSAAASVATALVLIATTGADGVSRILAPYFLFPPPIAAVFISGFFSRRASYVSGAIVAIVAAVALAAVLAINPASLGLVPTTGQTATGGAASPSPAAASASPTTAASASGSPSASGSASPSPSPSAPVITEDQVRTAKAQLTQDSFTTSPITSIFFASAAAWYRRFLRLGNPNRPPPRAQRGKPANRRR